MTNEIFEGSISRFFITQYKYREIPTNVEGRTELDIASQMDTFVRRQGYTWDGRLGKYLLPEERNSGRYYVVALVELFQKYGYRDEIETLLEKK